MNTPTIKLKPPKKPRTGSMVEFFRVGGSDGSIDHHRYVYHTNTPCEKVLGKGVRGVAFQREWACLHRQIEADGTVGGWRVSGRTTTEWLTHAVNAFRTMEQAERAAVEYLQEKIATYKQTIRRAEFALALLEQR